MQCDQIGRFFCTLGNFFKPLATINLPKSLTFLGNFCKGIKIYHFSSEIIFGPLLQTFGDFYLVTLQSHVTFCLYLVNHRITVSQFLLQNSKCFLTTIFFFFRRSNLKSLSATATAMETLVVASPKMKVDKVDL